MSPTTAAAQVADYVMGALRPRQDIPTGWVIENGRAIPWWYSRTGVIVKWSLFLGLSTIFGLYLLLGYTHARRRLKRGLLPLKYHRWMISRRQMAAVDPRYAFPQSSYTNYQQPNYYGMQPMPPPVYDPNSARPPMYGPPVYGPPDGGSKVDAGNWGSNPPQGPDGYAAPPGAPPPGAPPPVVTATHTGSTNNPYRL